MTEGRTWSHISASKSSLRLTNPIRDIVDQLNIPLNPNKVKISLSIGDPTVFGNLLSPENVDEALIQNIKTHQFNGYAHSTGYLETRSAIAQKYSTPSSPLIETDVVCTSGCSGALEMAIGVLGNEGQEILLPAPGFSIYQTICEYKGIIPVYYNLLPDKQWEADCENLDSLVTEKTVAILINNPSNPCGSVYSKEHLKKILQVAERHHLPIIADEIYAGMVFEKHEFHSIASLTSTVPVLSVGGISKLFIVPGWRLGWVLIHDRNHAFEEVRVGLLKLSQLILGPNTLIQSVIQEALLNTPPSYLQNLNSILSNNANMLVQKLSKIPGLKVISPGGAMYMMVGIELDQFKDFKNDIEFAKALLSEESVFVLPGQIFNIHNFVRLVICPPANKLEDACERIAQFCQRHHKNTSIATSC